MLHRVSKWKFGDSTDPLTDNHETQSYDFLVVVVSFKGSHDLKQEAGDVAYIVCSDSILYVGIHLLFSIFLCRRIEDISHLFIDHREHFQEHLSRERFYSDTSRCVLLYQCKTVVKERMPTSRIRKNKQKRQRMSNLIME